MNLLESRPEKPKPDLVTGMGAVDETSKQFSQVVESYLLELETTLDPHDAYEIVYPAGHQYGHAGLSAEYPALSSTGVIATLRWIYQRTQPQSIKECQCYVVHSVQDPFNMINERYVVDSDGRIRKIIVPTK